MTAPLIVLAAGGTGGHIFPAEALASRLLERGYRLAWLTDERGAARGGALATAETRVITARGLAGTGAIGRLRGALSLGIGVIQARRHLRDLRPSLVIGFGGYAAAPTMMAASQLGLRSTLHEQNAILGRANRLFAGRVATVCTSFPETKRLPSAATVVHTGMPVRPAFLEARNTPYRPAAPDDKLRLVVFGGSQGAAAFG